jgi:predicted Zn-dependent peptidase
VSRRVEEARLREQIHYYAFMRADLVLHASAEFLNAQRDLYAKVTSQGMGDVAARWLTGERGLILVTGPGLAAERGAVPAESLGLRSPSMALAPVGGFAARAGSAPPPRAELATPVEEVRIGEGAARGLRLLVASDPASDVLAFHVMAMGRSFVEPAGKEGISDFLHRLIARSAGPWARAELHARLESIGASVKTCDAAFIPYDDYYTTPEFSFIRFETLDEFHREAFDLLGGMVTAPRFEEDEIEAVRSEMLSLLAQREGDPKQVMDGAFRSAIYGNDALASRPIMGTKDSITGLTASDLREWHARYFRPENLVVAVVSGLPRRQIVQETERVFRFEAVPAGAPDTSPLELQPPLTAAGVAERRALGKPQARIGLSYTFDFQPEDEAALQAAALLLSDRMSFQLRERQGLAYDIGAGFRSWHGRRGLLTTVMGTRPENLEQAGPAMAAQIDSMKSAEVSDDGLAVAINAYVGRARMQRITRMGQAYHLCMDVLRGERAGSGADRLRRLRAVTPSDVDRVAERYFSSARACRVTVE